MYEFTYIYIALQRALEHIAILPNKHLLFHKLFIQVVKETFQAFPFPKATVKGETCFIGGIDRYKIYYIQNASIHFATNLSVHCPRLMIRLFDEPFDWRATLVEKRDPPYILMTETLTMPLVQKPSKTEEEEDEDQDEDLLDETTTHKAQITNFITSLEEMDFKSLAQIRFSLVLYKGICNSYAQFPQIFQMRKMELLPLIHIWKRQLFQDILRQNIRISWRCKPRRQECMELLLQDFPEISTRSKKTFGEEYTLSNQHQWKEMLCSELEQYVHDVVQPDVDTMALYIELISEMTLDLSEMKDITAEDVEAEKEKMHRLYQEWYIPD